MPKTVLITGSSKGIGAATVKVFADAGWNVAATSRKGDISPFSAYENVKGYKLDVTNPTSIEEAFREAEKDFGKIDVLVNNAGYALSGIFEETSEEQIRNQFDTNVFGVMAVTRQAIKTMRPRKTGVIVQVASMGGRLAFPLYSIYHSSKWAVEGFSESLQYELKEASIRIKLVEPGVIKTDFYGDSKDTAKTPGDSSYDKFIKKANSTSESAGASGDSAAKVARTIFKAANDNNGRLRYIVGRPAPLLFVMRKILPERLFFFAIRKSYRL